MLGITMDGIEPEVSSIQFKILPTPEELKEYVECFRMAEYTGQAGLEIKVSLNGRPGIVFQHNQGLSPVESITTPSKLNSSVPTLYVYGQTTEPGVMNHKKGPYSMAQVILKPHALKSLLGINAAALTNGMVELNEFSAGDLNVRLVDAGNQEERVTHLTGFLLARLKQAKTRDRLIEESLRLIHRNTVSINVRTLLEHLNISERQFERRFRQTVGISAQFYIRVRRFNQAIKLMETGQYQRLTDVAYALNFHDQSHFIRDIKAFSGFSPKSLSQKVSDFYHDQGGLFQIRA
jgi:AraC-like DNA-binding protein